MGRRGRVGFGLILPTLLVAAALFACVPPLPQWLDYHDFADQRTWLGVPHFANVASNALFSLIGAAGLARLFASARRPVFHDGRERWPWLVFFLALVLLGPASAWYHLAPDNASLFWDRLALSVLFMAWLAIQIGERIGARAGLVALPLLVCCGMAVVVGWLWSEHAGQGDLRAYGFMHFYPSVLILLLLALFPPRYSRTGDVLVVLALYGAALAAERMDRWIFDLTGLISGHTVKHLIAAAAAWRALVMLSRRRPLPLHDAG
ncbi:MAG: alkaline phytoceramidase [Sulfuritalea sp.]|nr:alkaline phytoceramidase [Sulfuritalea sp.]